MNKEPILQEAAQNNSSGNLRKVTPKVTPNAKPEATRAMIRTMLATAVGVTLALSLSGCGRKGALTLPKQANAITHNNFV